MRILLIYFYLSRVKFGGGRDSAEYAGPDPVAFLLCCWPVARHFRIFIVVNSASFLFLFVRSFAGRSQWTESQRSVNNTTKQRTNEETCAFIITERCAEPCCEKSREAYVCYIRKFSSLCITKSFVFALFILFPFRWSENLCRCPANRQERNLLLVRFLTSKNTIRESLQRLVVVVRVEWTPFLSGFTCWWSKD